MSEGAAIPRDLGTADNTPYHMKGSMNLFGHRSFKHLQHTCTILEP